MEDKKFKKILFKIRNATDVLDLSNCQLNNLSLEQSEQFKLIMQSKGPMLSVLDIHENFINTFWEEIKKNVKARRILTNFFDAIESCCNLTELYLGGSNLWLYANRPGCFVGEKNYGDLLIRTIKKMNKLRSINLSNVGKLTDNSIKTFFSALATTKIEEINFSDSNFNAFSLEEVKSLSKLSGAPCLKRLIFRNSLYDHEKASPYWNEKNNSNNDKDYWLVLSEIFLTFKCLEIVDIHNDKYNKFLDSKEVPINLKQFIDTLTHKVKHNLPYPGTFSKLELLRINCSEGNVSDVFQIANSSVTADLDYVSIRFEAFDFMYNYHRRNKSAKEAFAEVFHFCIENVSNKLIEMDQGQLKVFDSYLLGYFEEKISPEQQLSETNRIDYIKRYLAAEYNRHIMLSQYNNLNDFTADFHQRASSVDMKTVLLAYIISERKWHFFGRDCRDNMVMGFVNDSIVLKDLNSKIQNKRSIDEINSDQSLVPLINSCLGFSNRNIIIASSSRRPSVNASLALPANTSFFKPKIHKLKAYFSDLGKKNKMN